MSRSKLGPLSYNEGTVILHRLHLLGEEMKLNSYKRSDLNILAPLLVNIAILIGADWVDYWLRMVPDASDSWDLSVSSKYMPKASIAEMSLSSSNAVGGIMVQCVTCLNRPVLTLKT